MLVLIPMNYCHTLSIRLLSVAIFTLFSQLHAQNWVIDTQEQWANQTQEQQHLELKEGFATPTQETASYLSKIKQFKSKRTATTLTFHQSPVWQNWNPIANVGPSNLRDAPVFLALGDKNYWMFGRYGPLKGKKKPKAQTPGEKADANDKLQPTSDPHQFNAPGGLQKSRGGYHAWHSTDMKTWVHHGPVTEKFSRWVTSAEYVDGKFYIYYDYPNDQDPHLYIDDNLFDGKPGINKGLAFKDPSDGSDSGIFRDEDGKFHIIYENWSPINASKHAWDSPLAGHAVSPNGINQFSILKPAVDNRTKPTGETKQYKHPHWTQHPDWKSNIAKYQVHTPEQEAYGDWAAIKVGEDYYLFGDYDPVGRHMSACWFTSKSLNTQFKFCGYVGKGHPDPDIGFAEGKFYLITQPKTDFVSPGPWVEDVTARAGVDVDNDGKIDQWTPWQSIKENYSYKPGFAKIIQKTPAQIDLSKLPAGFGFQFEFKLKDTTANASKPIIDKVDMQFR